MYSFQPSESVDHGILYSPHPPSNISNQLAKVAIIANSYSLLRFAPSFRPSLFAIVSRALGQLTSWGIYASHCLWHPREGGGEGGIWEHPTRQPKSMIPIVCEVSVVLESCVAVATECVASLMFAGMLGVSF